MTGLGQHQSSVVVAVQSLSEDAYVRGRVIASAGGDGDGRHTSAIKRVAWDVFAAAAD
jgi:hypothetical protein